MEKSVKCIKFDSEVILSEFRKMISILGIYDFIDYLNHFVKEKIS